MRKTDKQFVIDDEGVLFDPVSRACRSAVMYPLGSSGRVSPHREQVQRVYDRVLKRWRDRAVQLKRAGLHRLNADDTRLVFARNCPPTGVRLVGQQKLFSCNMGRVCPHCYARSIIREGCLALEAYLGSLNEQALSGMRVVGFRRLLPKEIGPHDWSYMRQGLLERSNHSIEFDTFGKSLVGSITVLNVSLDRAGHHWVVRRSGVGLIEGEHDVELPYPKTLTQRSEQASYGNACKMLGWAAQYPKEMMVSPPCETVQLLNELKEMRLRQIRFGGALRNKAARQRLRERFTASAGIE